VATLCRLFQLVRTLRFVAGNMGAPGLAVARRYAWDADDEDDEGLDEGGMDAEGHFAREIEDFVAKAGDGVDMDALATEIKCFKASENRPLADLLDALIPSILRCEVPEGATGAAYVKAMNAGFERWDDLLSDFVRTPEDQTALIVSLEHLARSDASFGAWFGIALQQLVAMDLVSSASVLSWASSRGETGDSTAKALLADKWTQRLLESLDGSSSEEDSDDDSGDSSSDDDSDGSSSGDE
jgi:hypothetical protein